MPNPLLSQLIAISPSAASLPAIVQRIEAGYRAEFEKLLPFDVIIGTDTNLWSKSADTKADAENPSFIRQRKLLAAQLRALQAP